MSNPIVSIITPSFNRADIVHETAASIFNQTYTHWEWMVVDDGSTDNSWEVLESFAAKDSRVKIFKREKDPKGACQCRNIAIEKCTGEYLIFLDTDDLLAPYCLEQRVKAMEENPQCDFIIFPMLLFKKVPDDLKLLWNIETGEDDLLRLLKGDPICQGTGTLWKKSSFVNIGMWNVDLKLWQDVELHIRSFLNNLSFKKRMDLLPDVFLRISDVSLSRTGFHSLPKLKSRMKVFFNTCTSIIQLQETAKNLEGLRVMGIGIALNAIKSSYYKEAREVIKFCDEKRIFTKSEIKRLMWFLIIRKYKMYKISPLNNYFNLRANNIITLPENNIGKVYWHN